MPRRVPFVDPDFPGLVEPARPIPTGITMASGILGDPSRGEYEYRSLMPFVGQGDIPSRGIPDKPSRIMRESGEPDVTTTGAQGVGRGLTEQGRPTDLPTPAMAAPGQNRQSLPEPAFDPNREVVGPEGLRGYERAVTGKYYRT